jgi:hypothetical protein
MTSQEQTERSEHTVVSVYTHDTSSFTPRTTPSTTDTVPRSANTSEALAPPARFVLHSRIDVMPEGTAKFATSEVGVVPFGAPCCVQAFVTATRHPQCR